MTPEQCYRHPWLRQVSQPKRAKEPKENELAKENLKKYLSRRRWNKAVHTFTALKRMGANFLGPKKPKDITETETNSNTQSVHKSLSKTSSSPSLHVFLADNSSKPLSDSERVNSPSSMNFQRCQSQVECSEPFSSDLLAKTMVVSKSHNQLDTLQEEYENYYATSAHSPRLSPIHECPPNMINFSKTKSNNQCKSEVNAILSDSNNNEHDVNNDDKIPKEDKAVKVPNKQKNLTKEISKGEKGEKRKKEFSDFKQKTSKREVKEPKPEILSVFSKNTVKTNAKKIGELPAAKSLLEDVKLSTTVPSTFSMNSKAQPKTSVHTRNQAESSLSHETSRDINFCSSGTFNYPDMHISRTEKDNLDQSFLASATIGKLKTEKNQSESITTVNNNLSYINDESLTKPSEKSITHSKCSVQCPVQKASSKPHDSSRNKESVGFSDCEINQTPKSFIHSNQTDLGKPVTKMINNIQSSGNKISKNLIDLKPPLSQPKDPKKSTVLDTPNSKLNKSSSIVLVDQLLSQFKPERRVSFTSLRPVRKTEKCSPKEEPRGKIVKPYININRDGLPKNSGSVKEMANRFTKREV